MNFVQMVAALTGSKFVVLFVDMSCILYIYFVDEDEYSTMYNPMNMILYNDGNEANFIFGEFKL